MKDGWNVIAEDGPPKRGKIVDVTYGSGEFWKTEVASYHEGRGWFNAYGRNIENISWKVIAWKDRPEPYRGDCTPGA